MNAMKNKKQMLTITALLSLGLLSGCGDDGSTAGRGGPSGPTLSGVIFSNVAGYEDFGDNTWEIQLGVAKPDNSSIYMSDGRVRVGAVLTKVDSRGQRFVYAFPEKDTYMSIAGNQGFIDVVTLSNGQQTVELAMSITTLGDQRLAMGSASLNERSRQSNANSGFSNFGFEDDFWGSDFGFGTTIIEWDYQSLTW